MISPAAGVRSVGHVPPASRTTDERGMASTVAQAEGGTLAELEQWEPTGSVSDDLAYLAAVSFLKQTCQAVLDAHSETVALMLKADRDEKHCEIPGGIAERVWKGRPWRWDKTSDVLAVILEETHEIPPDTFAALVECLPERVAWRLGSAEKDEPGLRRLGVDPDELRHRDRGGSWTLRFTWGEVQ